MGAPHRSQRRMSVGRHEESYLELVAMARLLRIGTSAVAHSDDHPSPNFGPEASPHGPLPPPMLQSW
jgi:hypothetical protein